MNGWRWIESKMQWNIHFTCKFSSFVVLFVIFFAIFYRQMHKTMQHHFISYLHFYISIFRFILYYNILILLHLFFLFLTCSAFFIFRFNVNFSVEIYLFIFIILQRNEKKKNIINDLISESKEKVLNFFVLFSIFLSLFSNNITVAVLPTKWQRQWGFVFLHHKW